MLENLKDLERGIKDAQGKEEKDMFIDLLKDDIKEADGKVDAETQKFIDKLKEMYLGAKKKATPKAEKKPTAKGKKSGTPKAKSTPEEKEERKRKINEATGKTIEECKEILAKYEALRGKTTQKDKQRVEKLKDEDKIIDGTNVKTADATTETTTKQIPKKIKQEVDAIEKEAEKEAKKEVNPKGKTKAEVKKEVEEVKIEKIEEKVKDMTKDLAEKSNELIDAMTNTIKKLSPSKEEAIKFLMDIRNHIDALLKSNKFEFGGAVQSYDIAWAGGGRPMPMFEKGGEIYMNALDWGKTTDERNKNLDHYDTLKTDKERQNFIKKLKSLNEFAKGGVTASSDIIDIAIYWLDENEPLQGEVYSINSRELSKKLKSGKRDKQTILELKDILYANGQNDDTAIELEGHSVSVYGEEGVNDYIRGEDIYYAINEDKYAKGGTTRKKGLGWKRDRERLSQEPHEQAYKSKRKGDYSSFSKGGEILNAIAEDWGRNSDIYYAVQNSYVFFDSDEKAKKVLENYDVLEDYEHIFNEDKFAKGGKTTRGYHQDRARLSKEPHEQAYLPKRKGKYSSFEMGGEIENLSDLYDSMEASNYPFARDMVAYYIFGDKTKGNIISDAISGRYTSERADEEELSDIMLQYEYNWKDNMEEIDMETMESLGDLTDYYSYYAKGGKTWVQGVVDSPNFREGAFRRKAEARGMSTDAFMNQVLHSPHLYDERTRKQAQFMKNAFND